MIGSKSGKGIYDQEIRSVLGKMLFAGDDAFKAVATFRRRNSPLDIGGMMLTEHNVLIMDEPNKHLDLEAVSAFAWGLEEYKGNVIVASHDRDLFPRSPIKLLPSKKTVSISSTEPWKKY